MAHHLDPSEYGGHPATPRMLRTSSSSRTSTTTSQTDFTDQMPRKDQHLQSQIPTQQLQPPPSTHGHQPQGYANSNNQTDSAKFERFPSQGRVSPVPHGQPNYNDYNNNNNNNNNTQSNNSYMDNATLTNGNPQSTTPKKKRQELLPPASIPSPSLKPPVDQQGGNGQTRLHPQAQRNILAPQPGDQQRSHGGQNNANSAHQKPPLNNSQSFGSVQQFHRKSIGDWNFIKTIGAGSMGRVKLAQHNATGEVCAVKIVPRAAKLYQRAHANEPPVVNPQIAERRQKEFEKEVARDRRTIREAALGRLLFHPFICRLYEMVTMTNHYYMLFEYVEGGQMLDYIVSHGLLKERNARKFVRGIASALDYCHRNSVVHRDLKIENIMINQKGDIKIIDFGLSNLYSPKSLLKTYCGSLYFAAPELLSAKPYTGPEVDIWLFGVVLYVLVCGKVPFDDKSVSVLHEKIKRGNVEYPDFLLKECVNLLLRMLVVDPAKRATLYEIIHHPWMNKGYDSIPLSYLPKRVPLKLPLDPVIIKTIAQFDLGSEQAVASELTAILSSVEYQMLVENWYKLTKQGREYSLATIANILPDPTAGYHPLISIYYLVDEMRKRKLAKKQQQQAAQAQQQVQTLPSEQGIQQQSQNDFQQQTAISNLLPKRLDDTIPRNSDTEKPREHRIPSAPPSSSSPFNAPPPVQTPIISQVSRDPTTPKHSNNANVSRNTSFGTPTGTPIRSSISNTGNGVNASNVGSVNASVSHSPKDPPPAMTLSPPEPAHTSGDGSAHHNIQPVIALPQQQPSSPVQESLETHGMSGFNLLLRKLSGKYKSTPKQEKQNTVGSSEFQFPNERDSNSYQYRDPMVRRGVSMKITAKEKLSGSRINLNLQKDSSSSNGTTLASAGSHGPSGTTKFQPKEAVPPLPNINPQEYANVKTNSGDNNSLTNNTSVSTSSSNQRKNSGNNLNVPGQTDTNYTLSGNYNHSHSQNTNNYLSAHTALHQTARAKSVGGNAARDQYIAYHHGSSHGTNSRPPLPNDLAAQNLDEIIDAYFDDVTLEDDEEHKFPKMTEEQIMAQFHNAKPNTMPSIEYPKTLFLKGFFSVQTTSTKPLPVIRYNIISVLSRLGVKFQEVKGGFICLYHGDISPMRELNEEKQLYGDAFKLTLLLIEIRQHLREPLQSSQQSLQQQQSTGMSTPDQQEKSIQRQPSVLFNAQAIASPEFKTHRQSNLIGGHRRKFLIGQLILTSYRKKNGSQVNMPPNTPATIKVVRIDGEDDDEEGETLHVNGDSVDLIGNMGMGGSDMLDQSRVEQRARQTSQHQRLTLIHKKPLPLKFEILVVKVPLVGLYGVQFKKILGNTWNYKTFASDILNDLNL